ncbi:MAG: DUF72 domain-containing protein [Gemmatimonadaceae bacterium]
MSEHATERAAPYVGCAGWSLSRSVQGRFPTVGSHLERYASQLRAAEINSSFHRPHRAATYARWAASVPEAFRFSVKVPKAITHERQLIGIEAPLEAFLSDVSALGSRLGCLLLQLPPSLEYGSVAIRHSLDAVRRRYAGPLAIEPRNRGWFSPTASRLLGRLRIARVAADPPRGLRGGEPGAWRELVYYRLHGSPRPYYSSYPASELARLAQRIDREHEAGAVVWCIFDNTASGAAVENALDLMPRLHRPRDREA